MKYSVATNFDNRLIESIAPLGCVSAVYGKLDSDIIGGGRPSYILPKVSKKQIQEHIRCCHKEGIRFNYLLNALCLSNDEVSKKAHKMMNFIEELISWGVDEVTVANMVLLRLIRRHFPDLPISLSMFQGVDTLPAFKRMEEEGIQEITLHFSATRNFPLLRSLVENSRKETRIRLVSNNTCLKDCIDNRNHGFFNSHNSQSSLGKPAFRVDPFRLGCDYIKLKNPVTFISSPWIRPEDVPLYEELGQGKIVLKLTDRSCPTDWLINMVQAYSRQKYDGNLMDLLNYPGNQTVVNIDRKAGFRGVFRGNVKGKEMRNITTALRTMPVHIENNALDGFLQGMSEKDCHQLVCNDRGWGGEEGIESGNCSYCRSFAEKAVLIDEEKRQKTLSHNRSVLDKLYSAQLF